MQQNRVEDHKFRYHADTHTRFHIKALSKASPNALITLSVTHIPTVTRRYPWKKIGDHKFQIYLSHPPGGHIEIWQTWPRISSEGSIHLRRYSRCNVIETNQLEKAVFIALAVSFCPIEKFSQTHSYRVNA